MRKLIQMGLLILLGAGAGRAAEPAAKMRWWKGNMHAHSLYSDGSSFPETVVDWYKSHGYQFFSLTDHNALQTGDVWVPVENLPKGERKRGTASLEAYQLYRKRFGSGIEERTSGTQKLVRLKSFSELASQFNAPGRFLLIEGEEVTCASMPGGDPRIHMNLLNIDQMMPAPPPKKDDPQYMLIQGRAVTAMADKLARDGRIVIDQVNHPNWSFKDPGTLLEMDDLDLMEINNGASGMGDLEKFGKVWDAVLAKRAAAGLKPLYATGVDDRHDHLASNTTGKGWIYVRAARLECEEIMRAIQAGEFYATSGVQLKSVRFDGKRLALSIKPEGEGTTYTTRFIGQRKGGPAGEVLAEVAGLNPSYKMTGDEVYVRATVISGITVTMEDKRKRPFVAWVQPCYPGQPRYVK